MRDQREVANGHVDLRAESSEPCDKNHSNRPKSYPPFSSLSNAVTHGGIVLVLIENCGHVAWNYLQTVVGNLYRLGYAHPERWQDWDAVRMAMSLPGAKHAPFWPYLGLAIAALVISWIAFKFYLKLVHSLNNEAWSWFAIFIGAIVRCVLDNELKPWLMHVLENLRSGSEAESVEHPPDREV